MARHKQNKDRNRIGKRGGSFRNEAINFLRGAGQKKKRGGAAGGTHQKRGQLTGGKKLKKEYWGRGVGERRGSGGENCRRESKVPSKGGKQVNK